MSCKMKVISIFCFLLCKCSAEEWIDPFDMNVYPKINLKTVEKGELVVKDCVCPNNDEISLPFIKRFVSLLIDSSTPKDANSNIRIGTFIIDSEIENFNFLKEFNKKQSSNVDDLRKLDAIISSLFQKDVSDHVFEKFVSVQNLINILLGHTFVTIIGISLGLYIFYHLLKEQFSFWYITKYFFLVILIVDYGIRYQTLLEEAEDHNMKLEYSSVCDTSKMNWSEWYKFMRSHQKCEKTFVTPVEVAMFQLKHIIVIPLSALGTGMGSFSQELFSKLPFPYNFLIFPSMLLFVTLLYAITVMVINKSPIKVSLFHLINFEFGHQVESRSNVSEATLDKILDVVKHRPMVEDEKPEVSNRQALPDQSMQSSQKGYKKKPKPYNKIKKVAISEKQVISDEGKNDQKVVAELQDVNTEIKSTKE